jgi:hypothetical protein
VRRPERCGGAYERSKMRSLRSKMRSLLFFGDRQLCAKRFSGAGDDARDQLAAQAGNAARGSRPPIRSSATDRASASVLSERHGAADVTFQPGTPFPGGVRPVVSGQS